MRTTKKTQYALRAMILLGKKEESRPLSYIAKKEGISVHYLEKIFSKLEESGLVESKRGTKGGYFLKKNSSNVTLEDIFNAVGEDVSVADCVTSGCSRNKKCKAAKAWKKIDEKIKNALSSIKLSDLLD